MKTVLLADDEESTGIFVRLALKHLRNEIINLRHVRDGVQATRYLEGYAPYCDRNAYPFPDLVLLDLKMPLVDGFEVLEWKRANPTLADLPIVVLTEFFNDSNSARATELGATDCVAKAVDLEQFEQALKDVFERLLFSLPSGPHLSDHLVNAAA